METDRGEIETDHRFSEKKRDVDRVAAGPATVEDDGGDEDGIPELELEALDDGTEAPPEVVVRGIEGEDLKEESGGAAGESGQVGKDAGRVGVGVR
jgi:hypothetical protein